MLSYPFLALDLVHGVLVGSDIEGSVRTQRSLGIKADLNT